jgi:hypothetical protein
MMNAPLPLLVLALAFVLGGCVSISAPPRPAEWGAVQKTEGECPLVAGSYRDKGEGPKGIASLSLGVLDLGWQAAEYDLPPADTVTIAGPSEGKLTVEALRQGHVIRHKVYPRNPYFYSYFMAPPFYICDGDTVELRMRVEENRGGGSGSSSIVEHVVLQKATDGHLIVMHENLERGLLLPAPYILVPIYEKSQTWFRFEPIVPSGSSSVQPAN